MELNLIVDKLLDMKPDPIPKLVLIKEFMDYSPESMEYQNAYDEVCNHPFIQKLEDSQNEKGFWFPFHGDTEGRIRLLLSYGLDKEHSCLQKVIQHINRLLDGEEDYDYYEKQDNIRWWPEIFMPLALSAMLSLLDNGNIRLSKHRKRWADFAEISLVDGYYDERKRPRIDDSGSNFFSRSGSFRGGYDFEANKKAQINYFGIKTTRIIHPFNYYNCLLLPPVNGEVFLSEQTDKALVDYAMNEAAQLYYVYNRNPGEFVSLQEQNRDSRDFCHWIRALSLISQFKGWAKYEERYFEWILNQRNDDGLWAFPKKYSLFGLSNSWRGKNRAIDSTIYVLRFLMGKRAF